METLKLLLTLGLIVAVGWYSWPGYRHSPRRLVAWSACLLLVSVLAWPWLLHRGHTARRQERTEREAAEAVRRAEQRRADVRFQLDRLKTGSPLEQLNAHELLSMWGALPEPAKRDDRDLLVLDDVLDHRAIEYILRFGAAPERLVDPLPSGRRLTRQERDQVRRNGALYVPRWMANPPR